MIKMIWLQFKYSWRAWLGAGVVFVIASILMGMSLTGLITFAMMNQAALGTHNPTPVFIFPAIFVDHVIYGVKRRGSLGGSKLESRVRPVGNSWD
ncbi:hypothetical protein [Lentilactobacillus rapi]|uniref:hypothetical protein n=1 Tax=Lentilactobacillus rapi TaxID=481723 RepID=UPI0006D04CB0|nr:hypothetical protein [Lentilactobacillus rapi]